MNSMLKGFASELMKLANPEAVFVDTSGMDYEPNLIPGDTNTMNPNAAAIATFAKGLLGPVEQPRETIDQHKFNHWYRTKP